MSEFGADSLGQRRYRKPAIGLLLTEVFRAASEYRSGRRYIREFQQDRPGTGQPVVVVPGFLTTDDACVSLRQFVSKLGFTAYPWGLGRNIGNWNEVDQLCERIEGIAQHHGEPVSLIGWSLGGIYAREAARKNAESIRQVITLGSPFGDVLNSGYVAWLYDLIKSDQTKRDNADHIARAAAPVPVRSTALYSRLDGVVSWQACQEPHESALHQNAEVSSSHLGMACHVQALQVIAERLNQVASASGQAADTGDGY